MGKVIFFLSLSFQVSTMDPVWEWVYVMVNLQGGPHWPAPASGHICMQSPPTLHWVGLPSREAHVAGTWSLPPTAREEMSLQTSERVALTMCSPALEMTVDLNDNSTAISWDTLSKIHPTKLSGVPDLPKVCAIVNVCCFKWLIVELTRYTPGKILYSWYSKKLKAYWICK